MNHNRSATENGATHPVFYYNLSDSLERHCLIRLFSVIVFQISYPLECGAKLSKAKELTGSLQVCFCFLCTSFTLHLVKGVIFLLHIVTVIIVS